MRRLLLAVPFLLAATAPAWAQVPFPPGYEPAQRAFDALPLDERKAIQLGLVWTGDFSGMATGEFGRLTFQGLSNFQRRQGMQRPTAVLDAGQRRALDQAAGRARTAVRFELRAEPRAGVRVGLPTAHVDTRLETDRGMRFAAADQRFTLETLVDPQGERDLNALHERLSRPEGARTVAYQVLRPDFFVVSGSLSETRRYYTRISRRGDGLVGYTVTWMPDRMPDFDRINVAIANAFDPGGPSPGATGPVASAPPATGPATSPPVSAPQQRPADPPAAATPAATVLVVAPGVGITPAASVQGCRAITVAGRPARVTTPDAGAGLALLALEGAPAPVRVSDEASPEGAPLMFLAHGPGGLSAAPVTADRVNGRLDPAIPLQPGQAGGALIDRTGRVVGLVSGPGRVRTVAVGGVATPAQQRVVEGQDILRASGRAPAAAGEARSWAEAISAIAPSILVLGCQR